MQRYALKIKCGCKKVLKFTKCFFDMHCILIMNILAFKLINVNSCIN